MAGSANDPWLSFTNATHYVLDGVPMRIADNYRPKVASKDTLPPLRFDKAQSKALDATYEFKTEQGFIRWHEDFLAQAEEAKVARQEKLKRAQEEAERLDKQEKEDKNNLSKSSEHSVHNHVTVSQSMKPALPAVAPVISNTILLPQRVSPVTVIADGRTDAPVSSVNIQDFENLAEDPFDNLELKTINDMKELETVLVNSQLSKPTNEPTSDQTMGSSGPLNDSDLFSEATTANKPQENIYENPAELFGSKGDCANYGNMLAHPVLPTDSTTASRKKKGPLAAPRTSGNNLNSNTSAPTAKFNCHSEEVNIEAAATSKPKSKSKVNIPAKPPPPTKPKPNVESKVNNKPQSSVTAGESGKSESKVQSLANALKKDLGNSTFRPPGAPKGFSYVPPSATNTSTDDKWNVKDIEWPSLDQQTPTPQSEEVASPFSLTKPTESASGASGQSNGLVSQSNVLSAASNSSQVRKNGPTRPAPPRPVLPPSKSSPHTSTSAQDATSQVVQSLLSMGFERVQIFAAMKHIGSDTKKLVDHLCTVQKLTSNGANWQSAEQAVMICGTDISKAERFAKGYQQLLEFGFGDEKVKEALLACDLDVQKALDTLI